MTATVSRPVAHQPTWTDQDVLARVLADLRVRHPLVRAAECHTLRHELADVAAGRAFVLQGGDCAEPFDDSAGARVRAKADQLDQLADLVEATTGAPVVRIGRFAGQYAKPRTTPTETLPDGRLVPAFFGEAVNLLDPDRRAPDARRLLAAYDHAAEAMDALFFNRYLPVEAGPAQPGYVPTYVSHEALLLDFEQALVRADPRGDYASSAHLLWIGERTRAPDGAHVAFVESLANPVGFKIGPTATADDVAELVDRLGGIPGRLTLIVRMGAGAVAERFPALLDRLGERAGRVVWLSDPMHGNTRRNQVGQKTRVVTELLAEVRAFTAALTDRGLHPGGLHLELTPDPVTECVDHPDALADPTPLPHYESQCDPRLNQAQSESVVRLAAELARRWPARQRLQRHDTNRARRGHQARKHGE